MEVYDTMKIIFLPEGESTNMQNLAPPLSKTAGELDMKRSGQATAALILTRIGIFIFPLSIIGIVLGHVSLTKCKADPSLRGKGLARAALIIGYGFLTLIIICVLLFLLVPTGR